MHSMFFISISTAVGCVFLHVSLISLASATESSGKSIHYDDFCGGDESVIFRNILLDEGGGRLGDLTGTGPCVCFGIGVYQYQPCPTSSKSLLLHVFNDPACIHLPEDVTAFAKLSRHPMANAPQSLPLHSQFIRCNHEMIFRKKRELTNTNNGEDEDGDFIKTGIEVGHELMRNQMNQYMESVIAKLTGGEGGSDQGGGRKYPVIKLLDYAKQIMQKTCSVVNPDFFDLALNSFINLQLETFHIKEPYISYSAFTRIELAMSKCLARSKPHTFNINVSNVASPDEGPKSICDDNKIPTIASDRIVLFPGTEKEEIRDIKIPPYASSILSGDKIAEPLIETVWKMLVSAHSYCYMYFSDYFNDHHTFTVALLPLFTNAIQDIWLNGGEGYDITTGKNILYGGLLGNVKVTLQDIDWCVGASRELSPYPFFMNRPLLDKSNEWNRRRKKRQATKGDKDKDSAVVGQNYPLEVECARDIGSRDICMDF